MNSQTIAVNNGVSRSRTRSIRPRILANNHLKRARRIAGLIAIGLSLASALHAAADDKVVVVRGAPANDMRAKLDLKQDYDTGYEQNRAKLQAELDAGWPEYPLFFPGSEITNKSDYLFTNTLHIPSNTGWKFCGIGFGHPSGTGGNDFLTNFTMRAYGFAKPFNSQTGYYMTSSQSGTFCNIPVAYYAVQPSDKYQTVEVTGGTNVTSGWYAIGTGPTVVANGDFKTNASTGTLASWTLAGGATYFVSNVGTPTQVEYVRTTTGAGTCSQNTACLSGYLYTVTYTVSSISGGGAVRVSLGGTDGTLRTANGTYTEDIYCGATTSAPLVLTFGGGGSATCTIDNVSVGSAAVDVVNNRWGLDRSWCTGVTTDATGYFCPELIQCSAEGTVWDGIMFKGRRLDNDPRDPVVLFHQLTHGQTSAKIPAGKNHFTNCGFYGATIGILCGYDMRGAYVEDYDGYFEPTSKNATYHGSHADHLNLDKVWFQDVRTCVYLRNEQSVSHSFRDIRVSECDGEIFRIDSGGAIEGNGFWISGGYGVDVPAPTVVRLGRRANNGNVVLQSVHFDHAVYRPQLVKSDPNIDLHTNVVFNGGTLSVDKPDGTAVTTDPNWTQDPWDSNYKPNWHLIDVCGDVRISLNDFCSRSHSDDVYGLWPKCIKLKNGATSSNKPHILITGTQCWVEDPEDLIDLANSDAGAVVEFVSNYRYGGAPLRNGRFVVDGGGTGHWDTTTSGWADESP